MIHSITGAAMRTRRIVVAVLLSALVGGAVFMAISDATAATVQNGDPTEQNGDPVEPNDEATEQSGEATDAVVRERCGDNFNPVIRGAKAHWNITCVGNKITLSGWVEDTRRDGKCAQVKVNIGRNWWTSKKACPKGDRESFSYSGTGRTATAYLFIA